MSRDTTTQRVAFAVQDIWSGDCTHEPDAIARDQDLAQNPALRSLVFAVLLAHETYGTVTRTVGLGTTHVVADDLDNDSRTNALRVGCVVPEGWMITGQTQQAIADVQCTHIRGAVVWVVNESPYLIGGGIEYTLFAKKRVHLDQFMTDWGITGEIATNVRISQTL